MLKTSTYILESYTFPYEKHNGQTSSATYNEIVSTKKTLLDLQARWNVKLDTPIEYEQLMESFEKLYELVPDTKMRDFQYRFIHRAIFCAKILHRWGLVDSPRCFYCKDEYETIDHLFYDCPITKVFWERFMGWFECATNKEINLTKEIVFFCNCVESDLLNTLLVVAKQFIFARRIAEESLNIFVLKDKIMDIIAIERNYALRNKKCKPFVKKWKDLF